MLLAARTGHVARTNMAIQIGDAIETATTPEVRKIRMDSAPAKNTILSKDEPPIRGM
jgi:hypothetical protein